MGQDKMSQMTPEEWGDAVAQGEFDHNMGEVIEEREELTEDRILEMLDNLASEKDKDPLGIFASRLATMACKAAVKGNHQMSDREANALIDELLTLENPYHCPHGRPTIISMTKTELEKKFKRIV